MSKLEEKKQIKTYPTLKNDLLERFNQIQVWVVDWYHPWEGACQNREKVTDQFLSKCSKVQKGHNFDLLTFKKHLYNDSTKSFL